MKFKFNWANIALLLTGAAGLVASFTAGAPFIAGLLGADPVLVAQVVAGISGGLLTVAGLLGDDDGDGIPNVVDAREVG